MEGESNESCGKGFLYFYNLINLGISGTLAYLSVKFVHEWGLYTSLTANLYTIIPAGIILVFAIIVLITAVVGLWAVWNENRCTLGAMISLLLVLLVIEIAGGVLTYTKKQDIDIEFHTNLQNSFYGYYDDKLTTRDAFDYMQRHLKCCGVDSFSDWKNNTSSKEIPESCCIHDTGRDCSQYAKNVFEKGCYQQILQNFNQILKYITGVVITFAVFQLIGIIVAVYLVTVLKKVSGYTRMVDNAMKS